MNEVSQIPLWEKGCAPYIKECAGQDEPSLEPYIAEDSRGAVIVCPGGGYRIKAEHEGAPVAQMLKDKGVSAFVLNYRVAPCPHGAPLGDALRAIRVVRAMGYDKVAILGFSAGGHLACSAATLYTPGDMQADDPLERLPSRPDGLISCYSVVSFMNHPHVGSRMKLLGEDFADLELARRYSAELHVTGDTPPAFIWHTMQDEKVPVENSLNLAAAYSRAGVSCELHVFPQGVHGLGLAKEIEGAAQWPALLGRWLKAQGYTKE